MKNNRLKIPKEKMHWPHQPSKFDRTSLWWLLLALGVLLADQASKAWIISLVHFNHSHTINTYFNLVLVGNPGAAFSFLASAGGWQRWFFTVLSLIVAGFITAMLVRNRPNAQQQRPYSPLMCTALSLLLGGALGNAIDRIRFGYVIDFIDLHINHWHWPAFNLADSAITLGAILLIVGEIIHAKKERKKT